MQIINLRLFYPDLKLTSYKYRFPQHLFLVRQVCFISKNPGNNLCLFVYYHGCYRKWSLQQGTERGAPSFHIPSVPPGVSMSSALSVILCNDIISMSLQRHGWSTNGNLQHSLTSKRIECDVDNSNLLQVCMDLFADHFPSWIAWKLPKPYYQLF